VTALVAFVAARSAPGVTTAALACATSIDGPVLIVEASEDGGSLGPRFGLPFEPGLGSLAAAARHGMQPPMVAAHCQALPGTDGRVQVLVGPASCETAGPLLAAVGSPLAAALRQLEEFGTVLVDAGRVASRPVIGPLLAAADELLVVVRPRLDELQCLLQRLAAFDQLGPPPRLVLVGERPYPPREVEATLGRPVAAVLADDRAAAEALAGVGAHRRVERSALLRSAARLAATLPGSASVASSAASAELPGGMRAAPGGAA
jgi:hypothetical protein